MEGCEAQNELELFTTSLSVNITKQCILAPRLMEEGSPQSRELLDSAQSTDGKALHLLNVVHVVAHDLCLVHQGAIDDYEHRQSGEGDSLQNLHALALVQAEKGVVLEDTAFDIKTEKVSFCLLPTLDTFQAHKLIRVARYDFKGSIPRDRVRVLLPERFGYPRNSRPR